MALSKRCPECGSTNLIFDESKSEIICGDCGLIVEEKMVDTTHELRAFNKGEKSSRGGAPISMQKFDKGLTTNVGEISDIYKLDSGSQTRKYLRIRQWQERVSTSIERNLRQAMAELRKVASYLDLPSVVKEEAARVYNFVLQRGLVRGRSMESVVASCIYAACRSYNIPRTLDEISIASEVERKEIGRTYRYYISRFGSTLHLSPKVQHGSHLILQKEEISDLMSGRGPAGIAAAALYVSALLNDEKKTQREVADVAGITEVTIRNRYKELLDKLHLEEKIKMKEAEKDKLKKELKEAKKANNDNSYCDSR
mgnify:CR=1 FL=1